MRMLCTSACPRPLRPAARESSSFARSPSSLATFSSASSGRGRRARREGPARGRGPPRLPLRTRPGKAGFLARSRDYCLGRVDRRGGAPRLPLPAPPSVPAAPPRRLLAGYGRAAGTLLGSPLGLSGRRLRQPELPHPPRRAGSSRPPRDSGRLLPALFSVPEPGPRHALGTPESHPRVPARDDRQLSRRRLDGRDSFPRPRTRNRLAGRLCARRPLDRLLGGNPLGSRQLNGRPLRFAAPSRSGTSRPPRRGGTAGLAGRAAAHRPPPRVGRGFQADQPRLRCRHRGRIPGPPLRRPLTAPGPTAGRALLGAGRSRFPSSAGPPHAAPLVDDGEPCFPALQRFVPLGPFPAVQYPRWPVRPDVAASDSRLAVRVGPPSGETQRAGNHIRKACARFSRFGCSPPDPSPRPAAPRSRHHRDTGIDPLELRKRAPPPRPLRGARWRARPRPPCGSRHCRCLGRGPRPETPCLVSRRAPRSPVRPRSQGRGAKRLERPADSVLRAPYRVEGVPPSRVRSRPEAGATGRAAERAPLVRRVGRRGAEDERTDGAPRPATADDRIERPVLRDAGQSGPLR